MDMAQTAEQWWVLDEAEDASPSVVIQGRAWWRAGAERELLELRRMTRNFLVLSGRTKPPRPGSTALVGFWLGSDEVVAEAEVVAPLVPVGQGTARRIVVRLLRIMAGSERYFSVLSRATGGAVHLPRGPR